MHDCWLLSWAPDVCQPVQAPLSDPTPEIIRLRKDASFWLTELPEAGTEWAFVSSTAAPSHVLKVNTMETGGLNLRRWKAGGFLLPGLHFTGVSKGA